MQRILLAMAIGLLFPCYASAEILVFDLNGNFTAVPDLNTAATSSVAAGKTVVITSGLSAIQSNLTSTVNGWPADRKLKIEKNGSIGNTNAFVINAPFEASLHHIFTGSGEVHFASQSVKEVFPEWWGAKADGVTDCGLAVRKAVSSGADVIRLASGVYLFATFDKSYEWPKDEYALFNIGSNIKIIGEGRGTTIRMKGNLHATDSWLAGGKRLNFIGIRKGSSYSTVDNLSFDTGGWVLDIAFRSVNAVVMGGDHSTASNLYMKNVPGRNMIVVGYNNPGWPAYNYAPKGCRITNCTFINGTTFVPGNTAANDCSFIYDNGNGTEISGNLLKDEGANEGTWSGGIELHGTNSAVNNNTFEGLFPCMYIGYGVAGAIGKNHTILNNTFKNSAAGIWFISSLEDITIKGNTFVDATRVNACIFLSRNDSTGVAGSKYKNITIENNVFELKNLAVTASSIPIKLAATDTAYVKNNTFSGYRHAIGLGGASDFPMTRNIYVMNNLFTNIPDTYEYPTGFLAIGEDVVWNYSIEDVSVSNNTIAASKQTKLFYEVVCGYSARNPNIVNVRIQSNNITGSVGTVALDKLGKVNYLNRVSY